MPPAATWFAAATATVLALLLVAGVAAAFQLSAPRRRGAPWRTQLAQFAAASPWRAADMGWVLLALAAAQFVRAFLPASTALDVLAFQVVPAAALLGRLRAKPGALGGAASARFVLGQAALRWLAVLPLLWFVAFSWNILLNALGRPAGFQEAVLRFLEASSPWTLVPFAFFAVAVAPVAEEALFRGLLLPLLVRRFGPVAGLSLVALGFAALHGDLGSCPGLAVFAGALALAYVRTGTILVPIAMHALFNAANLALLAALARAGWLA